MTQQLRAALARFPRVMLGHRPTPLEFAPNLTRHLGGPKIYFKRDDCTGLAGGGNKTRKLEFLMAEAQARKADVVLTQGALQSNHVRQTAAAAARLGLRCIGLLEPRVPMRTLDYERSGNVLLDDLLGAEIELLGIDSDNSSALTDRADELARQGLAPYVIPIGGSNALGSLGYAECAAEIEEQAEQQRLSVDWLVHASGSTGTQAGLLAGVAAAGGSTRVLGVSVKRARSEQEAAVFALAAETGKLLGAKLERERVCVDDQAVGEGYGIPTDAMVEAVRVTARLEGILLDPVYTGKAMAALIRLVREGFFRRDQTVVFVHTGGSVGLFGYRQTFDRAEAGAWAAGQLERARSGRAQ